MKRRILAVFVLLGLILTLSAQVMADAVDQTRIGSVSVTLKYLGEPVSGGSLTLHKVGDLVWNETHYVFTLTEAFAESGISLDTLDSSVAQELADFALENSVSGVKVFVDENGGAAFSDVSVGLYLMLQEDAAQGFSPVAPFLVTVPVSENGVYTYDVDASPKVSLVPEHDPTEPPPTEPPDDPDDKLPQTGQINWPVPVLAIGGLVLFLIGLVIRATGRKKSYES